MKFRLILPLAILSTILVACQNSQAHPRDTLRIDIGGDVTTFDPQGMVDFYTFRVLSDLDEGLLDMDQANRPIPGMAQSWKVSNDGLTYTFTLRHDLKFSDGTPITAKDFVYSWQRLVNPKTGGYSFILDHLVNAKSIIAGKLPDTTLGVSALSSDLLKVQLATPDPAFLAKLTAVFSSVVPQHVIQLYGESWATPQHLVTSGAYNLTSHIINGSIKADKNNYYYAADSVAVNKLEFIPFSDRNSALSAYKAGNIDISANVPIDQYAVLQKNYPTELHTIKMEGMAFYSLNTKLPQLQNRDLRQALSMAIDREVLATQILANGQSALYSYITPTIENGRYGNLDYPWSKFSSQEKINQAQILYRKAGYTVKSPLQLTILYDNNDASRKVANAIASMWQKNLGIKTTLTVQDWKSYLQSRKTGAFVVIRNNWGAAYNMISTYTPEYQCISEVNVTGLCIPQYDKLINQADQEQNQAQQTDLYRQAIKLAMNQYASIPLYQNSYTTLIKPYIGGLVVESNLLEDIRSKWVKFSD